MIGLGAQVGVKPAPEYMFMIFCHSGRSVFQGWIPALEGMRTS